MSVNKLENSTNQVELTGEAPFWRYLVMHISRIVTTQVS